MDQKGNIVLIVLLVAAVVGGYFLYNYSNNQTKIVPRSQSVTFQTPQPTPTPSSNPYETPNIKIEHVLISGEYSFDIQIPNTYSIKKNENDNSLTKDSAYIYDEVGNEVLFIYTYAAGERTPRGNLSIDGVPFTINYFEDIQCLADLDATNWVPGTKPLFSIHLRCDKANQEQLDQYKTIIQSIKFSSALKDVLMGKVQPS